MAFVSEAPFTRERNRSVPYRSVPKSGTLRGCVHTGTLEITSFRSKKWNDEKSDTKSGTIRNRSVPFPCEQAMRSKLVQKRNDKICFPKRMRGCSCYWEKWQGLKKKLRNGTIAFPCEQKQKPIRNRSVPV